jgi:hypothetical protein
VPIVRPRSAPAALLEHDAPSPLPEHLTMKVRITINCDNDAFADGNMSREVSRILQDIVDIIDLQDFRFVPRDEPLCDISGNIVGRIITK